MSKTEEDNKLHCSFCGKSQDQVKKLNLHSLRLAFTIEEPEKAKAILKEFRTVYQENGKPSGRRYTKGHFKRGAE